MPKGHYDRRLSNWEPPQTKTYPPELVEDVRTMYGSGMTMREVSSALGVSVKVLQRLMPRNGIERRAAAPRVPQQRSGNHNWRGSAAGYAALHKRVRNERGNPTSCATCGGTGRRIEWANLTGSYADVNDYAAMCVPCHRRFDNARRGGSSGTA